MPAPGNVPPASWGQIIRDDLEAVARPPGVICGGDLTNIANGTNTDFAMTDPNTYDSDGFHNPTSNPERVVVPSGLGGIYEGGVNVYLGASLAGARYVRLIRNGATALMLNADGVASSIGIYRTLPFVIALSPGDSLKIQFRQTSNSVIQMQVRTFWMFLKAWP